GQLKTLESQARKAKRFYQLKEEYKELSLELARHSLAGYKEALDKIEERRKVQHDRRLEIEVRVRQLEAELEKEKSAIIAKEKHLSGRQKELNEIMNAIHQNENIKNTATQEQQFLTERQESLTKRIANHKAQTEQYEAKLNQLDEDQKTQSAKVEQIKQELQVAEKNLGESKEANKIAKEELDSLNNKRQDLERKIYQLEKDAAILRSQKEDQEKAVELNQAENQDREAALVKLNDELAVLEEEKNSLADKTDKLIGEEERLQRELAQTKQTLEETRNKAAQEQRLLDAKQNEYNLNKSLVENLEGFPESIKFLKKKSDKVANMPLLSDIIYCKEDYRVTIESYLEPFLNYLIAEDYDQATQAVNLLSDSSKGRAHFFILPDLADYKPADSLIIANAIPATEVIETDAKYRKLASFLLEDVYIVPEQVFQDKEAMEALRIPTGRHVNILSKSSKYVLSKYSLSGGSVGLFEGMRIGRSKTLEKLKEDIEKLQKERKQTDRSIDQLKNTIEKLTEATKQPEIQKLKQQQNQLDNQQASLKTKIENFRNFLEQYQRKNEEINQKIKDTGSKLALLEKETGTLLKEKQG
ncbi:MAG: hypothetical protein NXI00_23210, partial [Cytophagales bacterium]|nr:hypothetical protein [Cytophagales bacterium]